MGRQVAKIQDLAAKGNTPEVQAAIDRELQTLTELSNHPAINPKPAEPVAAPETVPAATPAAPATAPATGTAAPAPDIVQTLTNFARQMKMSPATVAEFRPGDWEIIGGRVPTEDELAQVRANIARDAGGEGGEPPAATTAGSSPDEPGPTVPPGSTAVDTGELEGLRAGQLAELPKDVPPHYRRVQALEGTSKAVQAFLKDQNIAKYLLDKGISSDQWEQMTLDQQNKLIREAPTVSGRGKHRAFVPEPEPGAPRSMGRWAHEGVKDIADTMRWMEAKEPAGAKAFREAKAKGDTALQTPVVAPETVQGPSPKPKRRKQ